MKCKNCGAEIPNDSVYCEQCGKRVAGKGKKIAAIVWGLMSLLVSIFLFFSRGFYLFFLILWLFLFAYIIYTLVVIAKRN